MIKSDGKSWPPGRIKRRWYKTWHRIAEQLKREVLIAEGEREFKFRCQNLHELRRCMRMFLKEPGTIDWIKNTIKPGEIFYDIGSNIGIYTIYAAALVGENGRVYSFEPHSANFSRLLDNIEANNFQNRIIPCNLALNDKKGYFDFAYSTYESGSAHHQLVQVDESHLSPTDHEMKELKYGVTVDDLIESGGTVRPDHIKLDVDGNEVLILRGMERLLNSQKRPVSLQVELDEISRTEIVQFLKFHKYAVKERHYTAAGLRKIGEGQEAEKQVENAIFCAEA